MPIDVQADGLTVRWADPTVTVRVPPPSAVTVRVVPPDAVTVRPASPTPLLQEDGDFLHTEAGDTLMLEAT